MKLLIIVTTSHIAHEMGARSLPGQKSSISHDECYSFKGVLFLMSNKEITFFWGQVPFDTITPILYEYTFILESLVLNRYRIICYIIPAVTSCYTDVAYMMRDYCRWYIHCVSPFVPSKEYVLQCPAYSYSKVAKCPLLTKFSVTPPSKTRLLSYLWHTEMLHIGWTTDIIYPRSKLGIFAKNH